MHLRRLLLLLCLLYGQCWPHSDSLSLLSHLCLSFLTGPKWRTPVWAVKRCFAIDYLDACLARASGCSQSTVSCFLFYLFDKTRPQCRPALSLLQRPLSLSHPQCQLSDLMRWCTCNGKLEQWENEAKAKDWEVRKKAATIEMARFGRCSLFGWLNFLCSWKLVFRVLERQPQG